MDSFITTFHIDWKIIIAQAINFVIVLVILYFLVLKPLRKMMSERGEEISGGLNDAKKNAELLKKTEDEYKNVLAKAREEAHILYQDGKIEAEAKRAEMLENAKKDVDALIASGKKSLEAEKAKMMEDAKREIVSIVVAATEKLITDITDDSVDTKITKRIGKIS
jgi:F-type H+-transporting ATPase subunit b